MTGNNLKSKAKQNRISPQNALERVAEYIVDCETNEYDSYVEYCRENELNPKDICGEGQSVHVYALALIGLGMEFPTDDDTEDTCND